MATSPRQPPPTQQPPRAPPPRPQDVYDPVPERQPEPGNQMQQPPRNPTQPPPARPGVAQPDLQPQPEEEPKPEREVAPEEALQLFRAGHKLKRAGDPPEKWFAASRLFNTLVLCVPVDETIEKQIAGEQLVLAED